MSMGEARALHASNGKPVLIVGPNGRPVEDHGLFAGVPYLLKKPTPLRAYVRMINGPGARPYIAQKTSRQWTWKPYTPKPAEIVFTKHELEFAERYRGRVMIEPQIKAIGHENKAWPARNWTTLVAALREAGIPTVQCGPGGTIGIADEFALTPSFRHAAAVLSVAKAFVGTEGGLMHAAAAVNTPAVILWSEFIDPSITGYPTHRNLRMADKTCGMRSPCTGCLRSMQAITPGFVLENLKELLNEVR
jgi:ADP-heptose:LPS heptosyltransferase